MPGKADTPGGGRSTTRNDAAQDFLKTVERWNSPLTLCELRDLYVRHLLTRYDCQHTARILGIGRTTVYRFAKSGTFARKAAKKEK